MKIYFYLHPQGDERLPAFQHQLINIAFGLKEMGIDFYANIDYWKTGEEEYLFRGSKAIEPDDCDVVVLSHAEFDYNWPLPAAIMKSSRKYLLVYIDTSDGLITRAFEEEFRQFDVILKQKSERVKYPDNCRHSWVFGLSPYMTPKAIPAFTNRRKEVIINYRHSHPLRDLGNTRFFDHLHNLQKNHYQKPLDYRSKLSEIELESNFNKLGHLQSGGRFDQEYLAMLSCAMGVACFGGSFCAPYPFNSSRQMVRLSNYFIKTANKGRLLEYLAKASLQKKHTYTVYQWDSWRFWETLACGSVAFHIDFDKYGVEMPVKPVNFRDYIGVDLGKPADSIEKVNALNVEQLNKIAVNGNKWAQEHYSPVAVAKRFMAIVEKEFS